MKKLELHNFAKYRVGWNIEQQGKYLQPKRSYRTRPIEPITTKL